MSKGFAAALPADFRPLLQAVNSVCVSAAGFFMIINSKGVAYMENRKKIGVLDTGIGGFTVVKELRKLLPNESIVYYGDNRNCPYGNKDKKEILQLTFNMLDFLKERKVKLVAIACNTISALIEDYKDKYEFPILDIITPTTEYVLDEGIDEVGILATAFTIKSQSYQKKLLSGNRKIRITAEPSANLAALVDSGEFGSDQIKETVGYHLDNLTREKEISQLILACTHYPIVEDVFNTQAPGIRIINPAYHLAKKVEQVLKDNNMIESHKETEAVVDIFTTGNADIYKKVIKKLNMNDQVSINSI